MTGRFEHIRDEFEDIVKYSQAYPFDIDSDRLMNQWEEAKSFFIGVFGGKTTWRSERPIEIKFSEELRTRRFREFLDIFKINGMTKELEEFLIENKEEGFFSNRVIKEFPEFNIKPGTKLTKTFKNFISDRDTLRQAQDMASRFIQEDKLCGYLYLSVDPRDFLTLSENNARWHSCHSLDGDYRAGNLSYMVDKTTVIAYIANGEKEHLKCGANWYSKKWRMLVHLDNKGLIYYNKPYPYGHQCLLDMVHRVIVSKFFNGDKYDMSDPLNISFKKIKLPTGEEELLNQNYILYNGGAYPLRELVDTHDYVGYCDLINSTSYCPIISIDNSLWRDYWGKPDFYRAFEIKVGEKPYCCCCGDEFIKDEESFLCDKCIAEYDADGDFFCRCIECGKRIYEDIEDYEIINEKMYCASCARIKRGDCKNG